MKITLKMTQNDLETMQSIMSHYIQVYMDDKDHHALLISALLKEIRHKIAQRLLALHESLSAKSSLNLSKAHWIALVIAVREARPPDHPQLSAMTDTLILRVEPKVI